ncbi:gliding motility lipoprotein GldH [Paracrocinitomix mangrovi]|uniref:gliding motility lipoprotein GldH n=1 Tax=Paracrocinitomix mangrovi TaxID=2862509 RepID=UPI001C8E130D|nr:gliding motility lipoprotein GldH [Paracrocinitomix mangrovi]UKN00499.1 gliding motility lipoprotein GldH [Paracrocinitomix mangrovi]
MALRRINSVLMVVFALAFISCESDAIYEETRTIANNEWMAEDVKSFDIPIEDTLSAHDLFIDLRTTTDYEYSNLYLFLYSDYPNGYSSKDTLEFILAKPDGEWYGENSGSVVEFRFLVSRGIFDKKGVYNFKVGHGMRDEPLKNVMDVGFRVELANLEN